MLSVSRQNSEPLMVVAGSMWFPLPRSHAKCEAKRHFHRFRTKRPFALLVHSMKFMATCSIFAYGSSAAT